MTARLRLLACLLPAALAGAGCEIAMTAGGVEGSFDRSLTVSGPVELAVTSGSGDIQVRTGTDGAVHVRGRIRAGMGGWVSFSGQSAEERVRQLEKDPPIEQSGNRIHVGPRRSDGWNGVSISYEITVPANARVEVQSGSGDLEVADLAGPVEASTGSGDIRVGRVKGGVNANTGSGDITLEGATAARASTGSGNVTAASIRGDFDGRSGSGDITVTQQGAGSVEISTGSGNVDLTGASGPVRVRASSGDIVLQGTPADTWDVSASSGDVHLRLPSQGGFDLDLESHSGQIETSIPITVTGSQSRRTLKGHVRGGGPRVHVTTSSGAITIR
jgi:hypothetical protein